MPWGALDAGLQVAIVPGRKLALQRLDAAHAPEDRRARACIAMMLAQMKAQLTARNLHIEREVVAEPMFPIEREAEEVEIEFPGLLDREDPQDRDRLVERDLAHQPLVSDQPGGL